MVTSTASRGGRLAVLWWLAVGHVVLSASCSPVGIRSGDWSVPGLPDADCLEMVAEGAICIYPLVLIPMWAGLGCGDRFPRFASSLLICMAIVGAACIRGMFRRPHHAVVMPSMVLIMVFSLITLCFLGIQRIWNLQIGTSASPTSSKARAYRPQFLLRHLVEGITLACCLLALYRFHFPNGFPFRMPSNWWQKGVGYGKGIAFVVLTLLPTLSIPWLVLAERGTGKATAFVATAVLSAWVAFDWGLMWYVTASRGPISGQDVLWGQLGASAVGLISSFVLRVYGYRLFRLRASAFNFGGWRA